MALSWVSYLADNYQDAYKVKVGPNTLSMTINGLSNQDGGRDLVDLSPIKVSGSRRAERDFVRRVRIQRLTSEGLPQEPRVLLWVPWLRPDGFDGFVPGIVGTHAGGPVEVVTTQDEKLV